VLRKIKTENVVYKYLNAAAPNHVFVAAASRRMQSRSAYTLTGFEQISSSCVMQIKNFGDLVTRTETRTFIGVQAAIGLVETQCFSAFKFQISNFKFQNGRA
jgi:hypothetical protein